MPNRILREGIITSERVNQLSWPAEVFYRRLMSVVDDFGRYWGKPDLLRAGLYPLHLEKVGNQDVAKWLTECVRAGLVRAYTVENKGYLHLLDFRQQVRATKSKFPHPPDICVADATQTQSDGIADAHLDVDVDGVEDGDVTSSRKNGARHASIDSSPVIQNLPLREGGDFPVRQSLIAELEPLYPSVDVAATISEMKGWLIGNPHKRKTRRGIKAFMVRWLQQEQEKANGV